MKQGLTELVFVIDRSGSMYSLTEDTVGGFNSMIEQQRMGEGEVIVNTVLFNGSSQVLYDRVPIERVRPMTREEYSARGNTALVDALGGAIHHIGNVHKYARAEDVPERTMFIITTDGMENASSKYSSAQVKKMIEEYQDKHGWEFVFIAANIDAVETAACYGIRKERAVGYHADREGTRAVYDTMGNAVREMRVNACLSEDWSRPLQEDNSRRAKK